MQLSEKQQTLYQRNQPHQLFPEYYFIKVNQLKDITHNPLDQWIYFLKHQQIKNEFTARGLQEAKQQLDVLKLSDAERRAYERYQDDLHQQASMLESFYGEGLRDGRKQGREEERLRIARSLLDVIGDDEVLAAKTGLSVAEVRRLRESG